MSYRKTLINVFINKIYLYDDRAVFFFNTSGKPKTVNAETLGFTTNNDEFAFNLSCFTTKPRREICEAFVLCFSAKQIFKHLVLLNTRILYVIITLGT